MMIIQWKWGKKRHIFIKLLCVTVWNIYSEKGKGVYWQKQSPPKALTVKLERSLKKAYLNKCFKLERKNDDG